MGTRVNNSLAVSPLALNGSTNVMYISLGFTKSTRFIYSKLNINVMPLRSQEPQGDEMSYCGAGAGSDRDDSTVHNIPKSY